MNKPLLLLSLALLSLNSFSQKLLWVKGMGGTNLEESMHSAVDEAGNVYHAARFRGNADFDPGPGTFFLNAAGQADMAITKLDANGNFVWAKRIGGNGFVTPFSMVPDKQGHVYISGSFHGTIDFDPGAGTYNLSTTGDYSIFILKLGSTGSFLHAAAIIPGGEGSGISITLDHRANVHVTGYFNGSADFDPGPGVHKLSSVISTRFDIFILKLDSALNFKWAKTMGGNLDDNGLTIATDSSSNVIIGGLFRELADFDPGPVAYKLTTGGTTDAFVAKLDSSGNFVWAKQIGGSGEENIYSLAVDATGNIFLSGHFKDTSDMDPGPGNYNLHTRPGDWDVFFSSLDPAGNFRWAGKLGGEVYYDAIYDVHVDKGGNMYVAGYFGDRADFDPGPDSSIITAGVHYFNLYILKLNPSGNYIWARSICPSGSHTGFTILSEDATGNIYLSSNFSNTTTFFPGSDDSLRLVSSGATDVFVLKFCPGAELYGNISGPAKICAGASAHYSVTPHAAATAYKWIVPPGSIIHSGQNTPSIHVTFGSLSGKVSVAASDSCAFGGYKSLYVKLDPLPIVGATALPSKVICKGTAVTLNGTGAAIYMWSGGVNNGIAFMPDSTTTFTVSGTDINGCKNSAQLHLKVNPLPVVSATVSPGNHICAGEEITLHGSGADTFAWAGGSANGIPFVPAASANYLLTGTDANGCKDTAVISVTVKPLPAFTVQPHDLLVITGSVAQFVAKVDAAAKFQWQMDAGSGFKDLIAGPGFAGVNGDTLTLSSSMAVVLEGRTFRCISTLDGCSSISNIAVLMVKNADELLADDDFIIYPNPAVEFIKINTGLSYRGKSYSLVDATGRVVLKGRLTNATITLELVNIAAGLYSIRIEGLKKAVKVLKL
jgi:hypothetical protein